MSAVASFFIFISFRSVKERGMRPVLLALFYHTLEKKQVRPPSLGICAETKKNRLIPKNQAVGVCHAK